MVPPIQVPPLTPSRTLLLSTLGLAALALLATAICVVSLLFIGGCNGSTLGLGALLLAPGTVTLCVLLPARVLRRPAAAQRRTMLVHGVLAGALNAAIGVVIVEVIISVATLPAAQMYGGFGGSVEVMAQFVGIHFVASLVAAALGCLLGLIFSAVLWIPVRAFARAPAGLDRRDRFHASLGRWAVALCSGCAALVGLAAFAALDTPYRYESFDGALVVFGCLGAIGGSGAALAVWSARRHRLRERWLDQVRREQVAGWAVVAASVVDGAVAAALPPLGPAPHDGVLAVSARTTAGAAYREQRALAPVALVRAR